jgi:hypothetical protein
MNTYENEELTYSTEQFGDQILSAWRVAPRIYWVQSRLPAFTRKLQSRLNAKLVVNGVSGGYLRTYEITISRNAVQKLLTRWLNSIANVRPAALLTRKPPIITAPETKNVSP